MSELGMSGYHCAYCGKLGKRFTMKARGLWCEKCPLPKAKPPVGIILEDIEC